MSETPDLQPLPVAEWDQSLAQVVEQMNGRPLNVHGLMAHHPALLNAWWNFRMHVVRGGELSARHRELVILRVAAYLECWYEWASHVERGLAAGLSEDEIAAVREPGDDPGRNVQDALLLRAVDECLVHHRIRRATLAALQQEFSAPQVLDIIAIQGMYVVLGTMIDTWGIELDEFVQVSPRFAQAGCAN